MERVLKEEKSKEGKQWVGWTNNRRNVWRKEDRKQGRKEAQCLLTCDACVCAPFREPTLSCSVLPPHVDVTLLA